MTSLIHEMMEMEQVDRKDLQFPNAPAGWSPRTARTVAKAEGIGLTEEHYDVLRALQEYFARHELHDLNTRELHDALEERFHAFGGIRYLYRLFPRGPIAQGCRIAGLAPPSISADHGFGSVM